MSGYPEGLPSTAFCYMEGHHWDGGVCRNCGEQLRCQCGRFVTVEKLDEHLTTDCPLWLALSLDEQRKIEASFA